MCSFRHLFGIPLFCVRIPFLFDTIRSETRPKRSLGACECVQVWLQSKMVHRLNGDCHWISSATERISVEQTAYLFSIWNGRDVLLNETRRCVAMCVCVGARTLVRVNKILYKCYYYDECDSEKCERRFSVYYGIAVCDSFIIVTYHLKSYGAYCVRSVSLSLPQSLPLSYMQIGHWASLYICITAQCVCIMLWLIE